MQDSNEQFKKCALPNTQSSNISVDATQSQPDQSKVIELPSINVSYDQIQMHLLTNFEVINCEQKRQIQVQTIIFKNKRLQNFIEDNFYERLKNMTMRARLMERANKQTVLFMIHFKKREEALIKEITRYAKQHEFQDCHIDTSLFFLYKTADYNYRHHIRILQGQRQLQNKQLSDGVQETIIKLGLVKVNYCYITKDQEEKQRLIQYLNYNYHQYQIENRLQLLIKKLKPVICFIKDKIPDQIKDVIVNNRRQEKSQYKITLPMIFGYYQFYLQNNKRENHGFLEHIKTVFFQNPNQNLINQNRL